MLSPRELLSMQVSRKTPQCKEPQQSDTQSATIRRALQNMTAENHSSRLACWHADLV